MLLFDVNGQSLKRTDHFNPATDSVEYLKAKFTFNDSAWSGKTKTALFRIGTAVYKSVLGTAGTCKVPAEVLVGGDSRVSRIHGDTVHVSLIGEYSTVRITTNEIAVKLNRSGYGDAQTPANPTESEYQQMTAVAADAVAEAEEARNACENARADLVGVKNIFANAIKGNLSGAVVFADDVSPVEHNPVVWVHGKNLLNIPDTVAEGNYAWCNKQIGSFELKPGTYTISVDFLQQGTDISKPAISARKYEAITVQHASTSSTEVSGRLKLTFTIPDDEKGFTLYAYSNVTANNLETSCAFSNFQIEKGSVATEYTPYIDASTVELTRCGKAIFSKSSQTVSGVEKPWTSLLVAAVKVPPGDYVASCRFKQIGEDKSTVSMSVRTYNDYSVPYGDASSSEVEGNLLKQFTVTPGSGGFQIFLYSNQPNIALTTECSFENICVEAGKVATGYSVYNGAKFTPNADGTVDGLTSLSQNMTIFTDTEGVTVECEYIRDTNKVIEKLTNAIIALGGSV